MRVEGELAAPPAVTGRRTGRRASAVLPRAPRQLHRVAALAALASGCFVVCFLTLNVGFWAHHQLLDIPLYEAYGDATRVGDLPYRDFRLEYPPGALAAFLAPELIAAPEHYAAYRASFEGWMAACGALATIAAAIALHLLGRRPLARAAALGLVAVSPLLLGPVILSRFDLWPALLSVGSLAALLGGRRRLAGVLLGLAIGAKLYPVVCLPLALVYVAKRDGRGAATAFGAIVAAVLAAVFLPFAILAPAGLGASFTVQLFRPLQVESLGASLLVAAHHLSGLHLFVLREDHGSRNVEGTAPSLVADATTVVGLAVLAVLYARFARGEASPARLVCGWAAAVVAFVAFGKVFSPQYMIWLIPLVPLVGGRRGRTASVLLALALGLTQLWFPDHYIAYANHLAPLESLLVLARDLTVVALALVLLAGLAPLRPHAGRRRPAGPPARRAPPA